MGDDVHAHAHAHDLTQPEPGHASVLSPLTTRLLDGITPQSAVLNSDAAVIIGKPESGTRQSSSSISTGTVPLLPPLAFPQKLVASATTLADAHSPERADWQFTRPDVVESGPATEQTGVGAGYFSPPQSPKDQTPPLPPVPQEAQPAPTPRARLRSRSVAVADLVKAKARAIPEMVKERRSLQSILVPSFLQVLQSPPPSATASTTPVHARAVQSNSPPSASNLAGVGLRPSLGRKRAQTYANGSGPSTPLNSPTSPIFDRELVNAPPAAGNSWTPPDEPGRLSPSSYLLDDDPFAPTMPVMPVMPMMPTSPPALSPSVSVVSLVDASDASMPGTPALPNVPEYQELDSPAVSPPPPPRTARPVPPPITVRTQSSSVLPPPPLSAPMSTLSPPPSPLSPRSPLHAGPSTSTTALHVHSRVRPAHTRPAFAPRPSLPSLSALARMGAGLGLTRDGQASSNSSSANNSNTPVDASSPSPEASSPGAFSGFSGFGFRMKKRKGKVGAGLPVEPWDMPESKSVVPSSSSGESAERGRPATKGFGRARAKTVGNDVAVTVARDVYEDDGGEEVEDEVSDLEWTVAPVSSLRPSPASSAHDLTNTKNADDKSYERAGSEGWLVTPSTLAVAQLSDVGVEQTLPAAADSGDKRASMAMMSVSADADKTLLGQATGIGFSVDAGDDERTATALPADASVYVYDGEASGATAEDSAVGGCCDAPQIRHGVSSPQHVLDDGRRDDSAIFVIIGTSSSQHDAIVDEETVLFSDSKEGKASANRISSGHSGFANADETNARCAEAEAAVTVSIAVLPSGEADEMGLNSADIGAGAESEDKDRATLRGASPTQVDAPALDGTSYCISKPDSHSDFNVDNAPQRQRQLARAQSHTHLASAPIAIAVARPRRASAVPRHLFSTRPNALAPPPPERTGSPASSFQEGEAQRAPSPASSVEDFGVVLNVSPGHFAYAAANANRDSVRLRPESLALDPDFATLPSRGRSPLAALQEKPLPAVPPSSASPSLHLDDNDGIAQIRVEAGFDSDRYGEGSTAATSADVATYIRSSSNDRPVQGERTLSILGANALFAPHAPTESAGGSVEAGSSVATSSLSLEAEAEAAFEPESFVDLSFDQDPSDLDLDLSSSPEHYQYPSPTEYFYEEDDSSMLPPLSTLPEEDPVFTLSPSRSRSRSRVGAYAYGDFYPNARSPPLSRKPSASSHLSYMPRHTPSSSLSLSGGARQPSVLRTTRHMPGSAPADYGAGAPGPAVMAASGSCTPSLRSQSSFDSRYAMDGHAGGHARFNSQGSMSSLRTPSSVASLNSRRAVQGRELGFARSVNPSEEELTLGARSYGETSKTAAMRAEEREGMRKRMVDDEELRELGQEFGTSMPRDVDTMQTGWRPFNAETAAGFDPGSSAGTIRPKRLLRNESSSSNGGGSSSAQLGRQHAGPYNSGSGGAGREWESGGRGSAYRAYGYGGAAGNGSSGSDYSDGRGAPMDGRRGREDSRDGRGGGGGGGGGGRRNRGPSNSSSTSTSSESESESDTDDYGQDTSPTTKRLPNAIPIEFPAHAISSASAPPSAHDELAMPGHPVFSQLRNGRKGVFRPSQAPSPLEGDRRSGEPEDDDVPLARSIPGALQAQKSIRQKARSERERRQRDRSLAPATRAQGQGQGRESEELPSMPERNERGRQLNNARMPMSSTQEAAFSAQQRAAVQQQMQATQGGPPARRARAKTMSSTSVGAGGVAPDDLTRRLLKVQARVDPLQPVPPPQGHGQQRVGNAGVSQQQSTRTSGELLSAVSHQAPWSASPLSPSGPKSHQPPHSALPTTQAFVLQEAPARTIRPMRSFHGATPAAAAAPPVPTSGVARRQTQSRPRNSHEMPRSPQRTSADYVSQTPPVPSLPASAALPPSATPSHALPSSVVQTRVYIGDMQRFNVVEAGPETNARDVLDMLGQQGDLRGETRYSSSWMLYEVCGDFGMERPIRGFELVTDVSGSWPKDKPVNCFMVKRSPFASLLATIPSSIPTRSGPVDYQSKKGKWSRRWLELREHGLWLSKREGKDDEFLCSLSAFDVYVVTRIQKTPKSFCFAVKSTDPISLFENKADYVHVFSCHDEVGMKWVENILLARSYILYQEKHIIFRNKEPGGASGVGGAALSRSGTRKRPEKTFVSLGAPNAVSIGPFEPGSLLAKRSAVA